MARRLGLALRHACPVRRDIAVPADDGAELLTDVFEPKGRPSAPTVLVRSPYGRRPFGLWQDHPSALRLPVRVPAS